MTTPICLLTRPEAQSREFARDLPWIQTVIAPILRIEPVPFDPEVVAAAPGFVFTSVNAVPFAGPGRGRQAICVGPQTAQAARQAGFAVTTGPGDADGLPQLLAGRADWLHLRGRHVVRDLPVRDVIVYDQIAQPLDNNVRDLLAGPVPLILPLFSRRSARLVSKAMQGAAAPINSIAISAAVDADYSGPATLRHLAEHPDRAAMIRAIAELHAKGTKPRAVG